MLARIHRSMKDKDQGFTLIELLVVMIIIGILASIAIPVFLSQRSKAVDSSMKSDARTVATEVETRFVDTQLYTAVGNSAAPVINPPNAVRLTTGNTATVTVNAARTAFCVSVARVAGATPAPSQATWVYISSQGGLQPSGTIACGAF